jgi:hypothetical protein
VLQNTQIELRKSGRLLSDICDQLARAVTNCCSNYEPVIDGKGSMQPQPRCESRQNSQIANGRAYYSHNLDFPRSCLVRSVAYCRLNLGELCSTVSCLISVRLLAIGSYSRSVSDNEQFASIQLEVDATSCVLSHWHVVLNKVQPASGIVCSRQLI